MLSILSFCFTLHTLSVCVCVCRAESVFLSHILCLTQRNSICTIYIIIISMNIIQEKNYLLILSLIHSTTVYLLPTLLAGIYVCSFFCIFLLSGRTDTHSSFSIAYFISSMCVVRTYILFIILFFCVYRACTHRMCLRYVKHPTVYEFGFDKSFFPIGIEIHRHV